MPRLVSLLLLALLSTPLFALDRGNVLLDDRAKVNGSPTHELWLDFGARYTVGAGFPLIDKFIPLAGPGHLFAASPALILFHDGHTMSAWDGAEHRFDEPGKGYTDIFTHDAELTEIAPMRSGQFLVADRRARLIQFDLKGRTNAWQLPAAIGAEHIELLSDQCTVLYTTGNEDPNGNRVRRFNICTNQTESDFATLLGGQYAGAIRQLPDGHVLVANGSAVLELDGSGSLIHSFELAGVTHISLAPDGASFWAAGVHDEQLVLRHVDRAGSAESIQIGNDGMQSIVTPVDVSDLTVVGEWRASSAVARVRATRH